MKERSSENRYYRTCCSKGVSHCHLHFGRDSKVVREVGRLCTGEKGRLQMCSKWKLLDLEAVGRLVTSRPYHVIGSGYIFGFLWLILNHVGSKDKTQGS